ncbi:MAG: Ribosomal protein L11 methyltransferase [Candidatus Dichloromethanomonas elyunquensis]|nr:MAG: Ribosomal protein L11 methyltransferase [Candidatus Dichloromethanomonas elyunquensis]
MNWMEVAVTVSSEGEEAVTDLFYRLGSQGVVVESAELIKTYIDSGIWDCHVFDQIDVTGQSVIKGYFPEDERLSGRLVSLREDLLFLKELFPEWVIQSETIMVKEEDWANEWKRYFKPIKIGRNFLVKPSWEEYLPEKDELMIEIDPGMAFGTGTHPTTSLCLEAIEDHVCEGQIVFDVGTGSGILAVAAAKRGAFVQAGDIDIMAVKIAKENISLNEAGDRVTVKAGNLGEVFTGLADVVIANIIADVIIDLLPQLPVLMKPDGLFMASGLIDTRVEKVVEKMNEHGLRCVGKLEDSGWVLLKAQFQESVKGEGYAPLSHRE